MTYIITGGSGLLGMAFKNVVPGALYPTRRQMDLENSNSVEKYFSEVSKTKNIEGVIHLAACVGGVKANMEKVSDFYVRNSNINNNILDATLKFEIPKFVGCLSTCVYPDQQHVEYPLTEEQLHLGPPHFSNFGYAYAKRMLDVQVRAARKQYPKVAERYITVIPNNLYGKFDNFHLEDGHVLPALIRKIWEAKINNKKHFEVWGDGEVFREFTYADDIAKAILFCSDNYLEEQPINIGNSSEYLLKDVINMIKDFLQYSGEIIFDSSKPKGQFRKPSSNERFINLGWKKENYTSLEKGLKSTCEWFITNYPKVRGI